MHMYGFPKSSSEAVFKQDVIVSEGFGSWNQRRHWENGKQCLQLMKGRKGRILKGFESLLLPALLGP